MALRADDLTDLHTTTPPGPAQPMAYRSGIIRAWNPTTLQNTVRIGGVDNGVDFHDLPVLGLAEVDSYDVGSVVGIATVGSTWAIIGSFVTPNTAEATAALSRLGGRIYSASDANAGTRTVAGFGALDAPSASGPAVTLHVGASGRVLVMLSAWIEAARSAASTTQTGIAGVDVSGANTVAASILNSKYLRFRGSASVTDVTDRSTALVLLEGLTPGSTTFTMVYSSADSAVPALNTFAERNITVFAL